MKRVWPLVALGVLAYLVLAVVTLPASVVVPRVQPPGVTFAGLDGTAWNGSAQVLQIGGSNVGSVAWKLHALPLLLLRADADVNLKRTDGFAQGEVSVSGSRIQLANLAASLPIQALPPQVVGGGWTGSVNARLAELTLVDGWPVSATGTVDLVDLTGPARNPSKLGTFQLKFPLEESTPGTLVGSINLVGIRRRSAAGGRARSPFFCGDFLEDLDVHDTLGQHLLEPAVLPSSCRRRFTSTASNCPKRLRQA